MIQFSLPVHNYNTSRVAAAWLLIGLSALLLAGFFAVLLVFSRTPGIQDIFPLLDFFKIALVVHVDLSVLIWFLAFAAVFWSFSCVRTDSYWDHLAVLLAIIGMLLMVVTPFFGGEPLMNNYVPILNHRWFINGVLLFLAGMIVLLFRTLFINVPVLKPRSGADLIHFAIYISAISAMTTVAAFLSSYLGTPKTIAGEAYHEMLSWGAGHISQFTHTELMLVAWLLLASASGVRIKISPGLGMFLFALVLAPLIVVPMIYISYKVYGGEHRDAFTQLMRLGGMAAVPLGAMIVYYVIRAEKSDTKSRHLRASLLWSIILFAAGGLIGFLIKGVNVIIPAHYHGCTVGVTVAFMGLTYYLLPQLGFNKPNLKWAILQPYFYAGGQLLHIVGLTWSGGYGVKRKTAGAEQGLEQLPEILGMTLMGIGGLISIVGGVVFLLISFVAIWPELKKIFIVKRTN